MYKIELVYKITECMSYNQVKMDKWSKMMSQEESMSQVLDFLEKGDCRVLLVVLTPAGLLQTLSQFPPSLKNKAVYFVKR